MRLGIAGVVKHSSAEEWASKLHELGCGAVIFPCHYSNDDAKIEKYVKACQDYDLTIAEVGAWCNVMHSDPKEREKNIFSCQKQLELSEYIGAKCCVNIAGSCGEIWDGGYIENYSDETRCKVIETTQRIIDAVNPAKTTYSLEPMPWMLPDSPESYLELIGKVNRPGFSAHLDIVNMISSPGKYFFNTQFIEKCFSLLGPYIKSCHVKDVRLEPFLTFNLKETFCGDGILDINRYASLASETDPDMPFIIEHLKTEEEYRASLKYVQNLLCGA